MRYADPKFKTHLVDQLELESSVSDRPQRQAEVLLHLSAAFFNGFGVQRDVKFAMSVLIRSANGGCIRAQALVKRVHDSLRIDCPQEFPLSSWLIAATETGSVIATQDLKTYFPHAYPAARHTFRTTYGGLGRPLNLPERGGETRFYYDGLHLMAMQGNLSEVLKIISTNGILVDINAQNHWGETPVLCACRSGHTRVVEALLQRGADPSINSRCGEGPLHWLSSFSDDDIPKVGELLLDAGAALDCHASRNVCVYPHLFNGLEAGTPLLRAVARRNRLATNWLLSKGALPSRNIYESNKIPVQRKNAYLGGEWIGSKGLRGNADFTLRQKRSSPLLYACMSHFGDIAPLLLEAESQDLLNCNSTVAQTCGLWGRLRDSAYVKTLSWTADTTTNAFDSDAFDRLNAFFPEFTILFYTCLGDTLFHRLSLHGAESRDQMINMINMIVAKGASLACVNKLGATALHAAVEGGNTDIAEFLLMGDGICRSHINTSYKGFLNLRPLHMAIIQDNEEMFRMLLQYEAELAYGIEACSLASHENMYFIHELAMRGGVPAPFGSRASPLLFALVRRHFALADFIIENWPEQLELPFPAGFNILVLVTLFVFLSGQTDVHPLVHLIGHLRQRNLVLCGPDNYYKGDIFVLAIVSSWGPKKMEVLDEDWEHSQTTKAVFNVLLKEYGHHESVDLAKAVHFAAHGRNWTALKMLLEFGADPNYISDMFGMKIGLSALDFALRDLNSAVPAKVKHAGDRAVAKYKTKSEEIVNILRIYGAQTVFDLKGYGVYGERVGAFIGYVVTFRCMVDILDGVLNFREDATMWGRNKRRWINNNLPYF
jgi:ankyrin repeat protein